MKKVGRKAASILLTLCMLLTMLPVSALAVDEGTVVDTAPAETNLAEPANNGNSSSDDSLPVSTLGTDPEGTTIDPVTYLDEKKEAQTRTDYTVVTSSVTDWSNGWYVVTGTVTLDDRVEVSDSVNLILADGAVLNATKGIGVTADDSLTIYGQSEGTGKLTAEAYWVYNSAAIGGTDDRDQNRNLCAHGNITINGGKVTATGAGSAAGIGGGEGAMGTSGTIIINGGTVTATGGSNAAGIGGGYANTTNGGAIIINGGTVTATGGSKAAGIGAGFSGAGMKITITGGTVNATGGSDDTYGGAGIGAGYSTAPDAALASITITGGDVTAEGGSGAAGIGSGSGTSAAVGAIEISGSAEVHATGGNSGTFAGAGIGAGGQDDCGSITISGGAKVTATGGTGSSYGGAGIGAGGKGPCDSITISDSADVTAVGGAGDLRGGAGIGAGGGINIDDSYQPIPSCNSIEITGGTVDATGGTGAAGIGGNEMSPVEDVSISGGSFTEDTFPGGAIPEDYLAAGYELKQDADGNWSVEKKEETPPAPAGVAQIGEQTYPTLEAAFATVEDNQKTTITLLKDIAVSAPITIGEAKNVIFDMKGHTITAGEGFSTRVFTNNGTLTITGNGTIDVTAAGANGYGAVNNFGTLNVVDGTYKNLKESNASTFYNRNGGTATFENPTIYGGGGCIGTEVNTTTTINGGYYENETYPAVENRGDMTITAGTFKNTSCSSCDGSKWGYTVRSGESSENAYLKIQGAAADSVKVTGVQGGLAVIGGTADIYNGVYETVACDVHTTGSSAYYAGYFTGESYETAVTIYDGTFQSVSKTAVLVGNDNPPPDSGAGEASTVMIKGGTFIGGDAAKTAITVENTDYAKGGASISGGTFSSKPSEEFFAEGFKPEQNEDGTWGVVTETTYVAQIGETKHATLSEALTAVKDGETIKVLAPATVEMTETYAITGKTITLDLNGQTVTWNTSAKAAITVKDGGKLTIQDTSANEAGELAFTSTYADSGDSTGIYVNPNGTFALQSGTISYTAAKAGRAIYVGRTGAFAMSGGTVKIAGSAKYGVYLSSNNSTNITGGEIILSDTLTETTLYGLYVYMLADAQGLAIENLTVDASAVPAAQCAYCITGGWNDANNAPVTISGGTYTTNENTLSKAIYCSTVKNLTISGGTFNGVVYSATTITDGTFQKAVEVTDTITGGTFEGKVTAPRGKISGGKFKVVNPPYDWNLADGKSFEQKDGYYCVVDDTNTKVAEVDGVQYTTLAEAINKVTSNGTITLLCDFVLDNQLTISDKTFTLDMAGKTITLGKITDGAGAILLDGSSNVTITGNGGFTFNDDYLGSDSTGQLIGVEGQAVLTIKNGDIYAGLVCVRAGEKATVYIEGGRYSASTDYDGRMWLLNLQDNEGAKFYVSGGTFVNYNPSDSDTESPADNFCTPEYAATPTTDESGNTIYTVVEAEAQIGDTGYATLEAAIEAAANGDTVKLLADVTMKDGILLDKGSGVAITLDLNGFTYTVQEGANVNNRGFKINSGTLNVIDSSEGKTGKMVAEGSGTTQADGAGAYGVFRVEAGGTLNVTGVTLENSRPWGMNVKICGGIATLTDVTIISSYGGGIEVTEADLGTHSQKGQATMINCAVTQTGYYDHCSSAVSVSGGSKLIVDGGTYNAAGRAIYVFSSGGEVEVLGGTFSGEKEVIRAEIDTSTYPEYTGSVQIENGTFTGALYVKTPASLSISGGTFTAEILEEYCAEGYVPQKNEDGTWGVVRDNSVAEIVGGQKYQSLIEAVNVAKESGQTVKLLANVELQPVEGKDYALLINNGESMTLDLNGHKITATLNNREGFNLIENYGELTITDTSEGQNGSIEVTENGSAEKSRTSVIYNGYSSGEFILEAGTLKLTGSEGSKKPLYGVYSSGTTVVMNGGAIEVRREKTSDGGSTNGKHWDVYGIYNSNNCQTTVNDGTITVENQGRHNSAYGIYNISGTVSIHGTPETPYIEANAFDKGTWYEHTLYGKITLYGGKYNMQTGTATGWIENENNITIAEGYEKKLNGNRTVSIVKSPVAQIGSTKYDTLEEALKEAKSGDTIKLLQNVALTDRVIISKNITLNLNDKTISSTADYAFIVNTGSSFTLENGTLSASKNGVFGFKGSTITLASDAKITAAVAGILATNSKADEGNATINVYGTIHSQDIAVWSQGPKNTINIDSATITSKYFGVYQNGSFGGTTITIKNSTITDESENGTGIYVSNNGTNAENPDQGFQNLIIENSQITGNTAVEVKFTNVTISGDDTCLTATGTPVDSGMNNNGSVTTGYAFAVTHNGTESSKDAAKGTVTISGGKFTGAVGIQEPSEGETTSATIAISGGSFSEEPNKDYLAPYYKATQNTTGDNYWTVDVAADVEAIWITDTDTKAGMLSDLLGKATSGTVQLLKDVTTTAPVYVNEGATLDLAGKTLTAEALSTFGGYVKDSTEGEGLLKVGVTRNTPNITLKENNPSLLIYDSDAAGYRLYSYTFEKLRAYTTDQSGKSMGFYFRLTFENLAAWGKLNTAETTHGVIMSTVLELPNKTIMTVYFDQSTIQGVAGSIVGGAAQTGKGFWLTVTGLNKLEAGQTLKVTPTLEAAGDKLVINTEAFEYSKSADESN